MSRRGGRLFRVFVNRTQTGLKGQFCVKVSAHHILIHGKSTVYKKYVI